MNKLFIILLVCIATINLFSQENVAISLKVDGKVELTRGDEVSRTKTGDTYINNDQLESSENSYAAIKFIDGSSVVKLFPNSILTIQTEKKNKKMNKKSYLHAGNLWSKVLKKTGSFEIETPTTVVSVKGTDFLLEVTDTGVTRLFTFEGQVRITNKKDGKTALVNAGQKAIANGNTIDVSTTNEGDINSEILDNIEGTDSLMKFELKNGDGEHREVEIEFE